MQNISIEIEHTGDNRLAFDLMGMKADGSLQMERTVPDNIQLAYKRETIQKGIDFPTITEIAATIAISASSSVLAAFLYDFLKGRGSDRNIKLRINKRTVELEKNEIKRIIDEEITSE